MPAYLAINPFELRRRAERGRARLNRCVLCPWRCRVDRLAGELGECRTGALARVEGACAHFGEERALVGRGGSGTIFFAGCNLHCVFCQNAEISHPAADPLPSSQRGAASTGAAVNAPTQPPRLPWEVTADRLAQMMLDLEAAGCENINFVSPSHVVPQILEALVIAAEKGLRLPLVYNTGGYDSIATLRLLDGVVDVYMPDMKYAEEAVGQRLSGVPDYVRRNRAAVLEMHRQVADLQVDEQGVARHGLLVRHLVLPGDLAGTAEVARFLAERVSRDTYINVMDQYHPAHMAARYPEIARPLTAPDYQRAVEETLATGLWRLDS
jgi:putative pyruvate formate lyase activating enzyme